MGKFLWFGAGVVAAAWFFRNKPKKLQDVGDKIEDVRLEIKRNVDDLIKQNFPDTPAPERAKIADQVTTTKTTVNQ